jgi:hypothetical protein
MKKKGDCIAVQSLDHKTTQHDYEQKARKTQNTPLEQTSANNPRITQAGGTETRTTDSHAQQTQTPQYTPLWSTTNIIVELCAVDGHGAAPVDRHRSQR